MITAIIILFLLIKIFLLIFVIKKIRAVYRSIRDFYAFSINSP